MTLQKVGISLIIFSTLFFLPWCADAFVLPKFLPILLGTMCLWFSDNNMFLRNTDYAILVFIGAMMISTANSVDPLMSLMGPRAMQWYGLSEVLIYALIVVAVSCSDVDSQFIINAILWSMIPIGLIGIAQKIAGSTLIGIQIQDGRIPSTLGGCIYLGAYMALVVPLAWARMRLHDSPLNIFILLLSAFCLWACRSRGGVIGASVGVLFWECQMNKDSKRIIILLSGLMASVLLLNHHISDANRVEIWKSGLSAFWDHPFVGWGPDNFSLAFRKYETAKYLHLSMVSTTVAAHAHNDFIQIATTMGIIGYVAYMFFLAVSAFMLRDADQTLTAAIIGLFVYAKVNPIPMVVMSIAAVIYGLANRNIHPVLYIGRKTALGMFITCTILFIFSCSFCMAEAYQKKAITSYARKDILGEMTTYNEAVKYNPWDFWYVQCQLSSVWEALPWMNKASQIAVTDSAVAITQRNLILHPNDPNVLEWSGIALASRKMLGASNKTDLREAEMQFASTTQNAPTFISTINRQMEVAKILQEPIYYSILKSNRDYLMTLAVK